MGELIKGALNVKTFFEISSYLCDFFPCIDLIIFTISWVDVFLNFVFGNELLVCQYYYSFLSLSKFCQL